VRAVACALGLRISAVAREADFNGTPALPFHVGHRP